MADQPRGIGIFDEAGFGADRAGDSDPHRAARTEIGFRAGHEVMDRPHRLVVFPLRRRNAAAKQFAPCIVERDDFDFGAADVDAKPHIYREACWRRLRTSLAVIEDALEPKRTVT